MDNKNQTIILQIYNNDIGNHGVVDTKHTHGVKILISFFSKVL